jgi:hypothetical protein
MSTYIAPEKNNYPGLDRGFNQRFKLDNDLSQSQGEGVYLVSDADDIVKTLQDLHELSAQSGEIKVISGGHCYENFTFQSATDTHSGTKTRFVIDLSNMRGISEEEKAGKKYIVVEPGASNWLIQQTLHAKYGAALPGGSCYSVCAGGHIAGGGYGLLSRLHGLVVDYLAGVEMVIPDTTEGKYKIRAFTPGNDEDRLNWASRGGGSGHFGIITKYYFEKLSVPAAPEHALFISFPVPWAQFSTDSPKTDAANFAAFLQSYYTACAQLPEQAFTLGKFTFRQNSSDFMAISMQVVYGDHSGHDSATLGGQDVPALTRDEAIKAIDDFIACVENWIPTAKTKKYSRQPYYLPGHPVSAAVQLNQLYDLPWIDMTQMLNGSGENQCGKYKSSCMVENFIQPEGEEIFYFLTGTQQGNEVPDTVDKAQTLIQIDSYGKQINAMDNMEQSRTAVAARNSVLKLQYQTYWKNYENRDEEQRKAVEKAIVTWFNEGYNRIHYKGTNNASGFPVWGDKYQGCYFNYPDRQLGVNPGYISDPGEQYGDFLLLYFGEHVRKELLAIKTSIDPMNKFAFSQSVLNPGLDPDGDRTA